MPYPYYGNPYYPPPMQDNLAQLRQNQMMGMPQMQAQQPVQQNPSPIIWVSNYQAAENYIVTPNNAVVLWDSSTPTIYLKQADSSGKPSIKIYDLIERNGVQQSTEVNDNSIAELKDKFDLLKKDVEAIKEKMNSANQNL